MLVLGAGSLEAITKKSKREQDAKAREAVPYDEAVLRWMGEFAEILHTIDKKHYKVAHLDECMNKALDSFLYCLDPHSGYLDADAKKEMFETTSGEFFGIGVVIDSTRQTKDKFLLIVDIIPGGPADNVGIKALDKIIEIDGKPLEGMETDEATERLRGGRHTKVHVKILRENQPDILSFDILRDVVQEQSSLCFYLPDHDVYYLSLTKFSDTSFKQVADLLKKTQKNPCRALVLDVRNNSGGLLTAVVDIASLFLEKNSLVVVTKDKHGKQADKPCLTTRDPIANDQTPIFILVNNYTASAAEILAGCLKIHSDTLAQKSKKQKKLMVFVVGSRTFGKGSVQEIIPLNSSDSMIKITTALYFLPENISIQGLGIEPDFVVERRLPMTEQMEWFTKFYGRESTLPNYIKLREDQGADKAEAAEKKGTDKGASARLRALLSEKDNQFREAITLINIYHTAKTHCPDQVANRRAAVSFINKVHVIDSPLKMEDVKI
jgi:carboxyl-terminal processing protease